MELGTCGPLQLKLLCKPENPRGELSFQDGLVQQERRCWIEEGTDRHGVSAVVQVLGRKPR